MCLSNPTRKPIRLRAKRLQISWKHGPLILAEYHYQYTPRNTHPMAAATLFRRSSAIKSIAGNLRAGASLRNYASISEGTDLVSAAPNVSLQKARSWDEGVSSKFATTSLLDIFKVFYTYMFIYLNISFRVFFFLIYWFHFYLFWFCVQDKKIVIFGLPVSYISFCVFQFQIFISYGSEKCLK